MKIGFVSMVAAAALAGCNSQDAYHRDWQQCVDQHDVVVEDRYCDQTGHLGGTPYYHWWYASRPYYPGSTVVGGYAAPHANMETARASGADRGGFGASAHGGGGE